MPSDESCLANFPKKWATGKWIQYTWVEDKCMVHAVYVAGGWRCVNHGWICHSKWVILPSMQLSKPIPFEVKTDKEGRRVHLPFSLTWEALANLASFLFSPLNAELKQTKTVLSTFLVILFIAHTFWHIWRLTTFFPFPTFAFQVNTSLYAPNPLFYRSKHQHPQTPFHSFALWW